MQEGAFGCLAPLTLGGDLGVHFQDLVATFLVGAGNGCLHLMRKIQIFILLRGRKLNPKIRLPFGKELRVLWVVSQRQQGMQQGQDMARICILKGLKKRQLQCEG